MSRDARMAGPARYNQIRLASNKIADGGLKRAGVAGRVVQLDFDILAVNIAVVAQTFAEALDEWIGLRLGRKPENAGADPSEPVPILPQRPAQRRALQ